MGPSCLDCFYFRLCRFDRSCSHPDHPRIIYPPYPKCADWTLYDEKNSDNLPKVAYEVSASLEGKGPFKSYSISHNGRSITCNLCGKMSFNIGDVKYRFCGNCKIYHDEYND